MAVVTLNEVKAHLNIGTSTTHDVELADFLARAEAAIARRLREITPTPSTVRVDGRGVRGLCLPSGQAIASVTSVTPVGGVAIDMADLHVKESAGVIEYDDGAAFQSRAYDVAYVAGFDATPDDVKLAVLELTRHFWDTQRAVGGGRIGSGVDDSAANTLPGSERLYPYRVEQLLAPFIGVQVR